MSRTHTFRRLFVALSCLALLGLATSAGAKKPSAPTTPPPPPAPPPDVCATANAAFDFDGDQLDDQTECSLGLSVAAGDAVDVAAGDLDPAKKDLFVQLSPAGWTQAFGTSFAELESLIEADLALNLHLVPAGAPSACGAAEARCVTHPPQGATKRPHWVEIIRDTALGVSCGARSVPEYARTSVSNNVEKVQNSDGQFSTVVVNTGVIEQDLTCKGNAGDLQAYVRYILVHEILHNLKGTHLAAGGGFYLDSAATVDSQGRLLIPSTFGPATVDSVATGTTPAGATSCGDFTTADGDGLEACAPK